MALGDAIEVDSGSFTPQSLVLRRRLAEAMLQRGMDTAPIGHWSQGINRMIQALMGGYQIGELERKEGAQGKAANEAILSLLGPSQASPVSAPPVEPSLPSVVSQASPAAPAAAIDPAIAPFAGAIASIESPGEADPYRALGPVVKSGDRAYGKYQVMGENVPAWTKEILGQEMTPEQFLANPEAQEKVFAGKFGQYLQKTGNPQDAASMWFTGRPAKGTENAQARDANGNPIGIKGSEYVEQFSASLNGSPVPASRPVSAPAALPLPAAATQAASPPQVDQQTRTTIARLLANPATKRLGEAMIMDIRERQMAASKPMTPMEQVELASKQANLVKTQAETAKTKGEMPKTPEEVATQFTGGLEQLGRLPAEFGTEAFERAVGPWSATTPADDNLDRGSILGTSIPISGFGQQIARGFGEAKAALFGGAAPTEVRDRIETAMKNLAAVMKPLIRKPGEGAWSDKDQANLEAQIGQLSRSRDVSEYRRRLNDIEENMQKIFQVPVQKPQIPERSANAPKTAEEERTTVEAVLENTSDEKILEFLNKNVFGQLRKGNLTPEEQQEMMVRAMQAGGY